MNILLSNANISKKKFTSLTNNLIKTNQTNRNSSEATITMSEVKVERIEILPAFMTQRT